MGEKKKAKPPWMLGGGEKDKRWKVASKIQHLWPFAKKQKQKKKWRRNYFFYRKDKTLPRSEETWACLTWWMKQDSCLRPSSWSSEHHLYRDHKKIQSRRVINKGTKIQLSQELSSVTLSVRRQSSDFKTLRILDLNEEFHTWTN